MKVMIRVLSRRVLPAVIFALVASSAFATGDTVRLPVLYDTFVPPPLGHSYTDPAFGVAIKRLSDAVNTPNQAGSGNLLWVGTEYPTASPFNSDNSWLILQHQSYFGLYDGDGAYVRDLPFAVNAATEPRWSRTDADALFYVTANRLMKLDVSAGTSSIIRTFSEYSAIRGRGESEISLDGDHFVFAGDEPGGLVNRYVFVYQISTDTKGAVLDTFGHSFNQLYLASDNSVALGWLARGTTRFTGVELFDQNMRFQRQLTHAIGHMHLTRDANLDDVLIWTNSNDPLPIPNCQNGIVKIKLSNAHQTCLLPLDWSLAVHITAGDGDGWVFLETYDPTDPPATGASWRVYTNEILRLKLDGSEVRRLAHHRSRQTSAYEYQPRATVSRDGSRLLYSSTYNLQGTSGYAYGYTDAYLLAVPALVPPGVSIGEASVVEGGSGPRNLTFTVNLSHPSDLPIVVSWASADGTAMAPIDYLSTAGTVTFIPGDVAKTLTVTVNGDGDAEADESVGIGISGVTNAVLDDGFATGTILNDDLPTTFLWTRLAGVSVNGTSLVRGSGPPLWNAGAISVPVLSAGDGYVEFDATETTSYRMLGLGRGDVNQGFPDLEWAVYLTGNGAFQLFESGVAKTGPMPYATGDRFRVAVESGIVTYRHNGTLSYTSDVPPTYPLVVDTSMYTPGATLANARLLGFAVPPILVSIRSRTVEEGNTGTRPILFDVRLSQGTDSTVVVDWSTVDATAVAPADYLATGGTLSFSAGETRKAITVQVVGDRVAEGSESFQVSLTNPSPGALIDVGQATGTILDSDSVTDRSRLMFHNFATNRLYRWHMKNGNTLDKFNWVTPWATDPGWTVGAVADFDRDGQLDYLWHNVDDGRLLFWYIDGDNLGGYQFLPYTMGPPWQIATSFDANGDETTDIVYYNPATGVVRIALHDDAVKLSHYDLTTNLPGAGTLRIVNSDDTNQDGQEDPLLYDSATGVITAWILTGAQVTNTITFPDRQATSPAYTLVSTRTDFNNDGFADFLWHNPTPTGIFSVWFMNGMLKLGTGVFEPFTATDPVWRVVGSGNIFP
ncbi:MAG: hypothetical protein KBH14_09570 [Vicinamibacteria bacterium]|jgi:hypothetical protein|nr:hypothetical protein [Vicinamibacteria bacterium]MBP9946633.1 hypothetical protein [Vicinamibacteria bacterium]